MHEMDLQMERNRQLSYGMRRGGLDRMGLDEMDWDKMMQYDIWYVLSMEVGVDGMMGWWDLMGLDEIHKNYWASEGYDFQKSTICISKSYPNSKRNIHL